MKTVLKDFKAFLLKNDIVTYAVAFIMALALKAVVNSLVDNFIMPLVSFLTGGADFSIYFFTLSGGNYPTIKAAKEAGVAVFTYGHVIQAVLNFIFIGLVVFLLVKGYEKTKKKKEEEPAAPAGPTQEDLLAEIRDELKQMNK